MTEEWRDIPGFGGRYQASTDGRVRSIDWTYINAGRVMNVRGKLFKGTIGSHGYRTDRFRVDGSVVHWTRHATIAHTFLGERPAGMDVRHLDSNKLNNAASNLAYGTRSENMIDEVALGKNANTAKTSCPQGHPLSGSNLIDSPGKRGRRQRICRRCAALHQKILKSKRRDAKLNKQEKSALDMKLDRPLDWRKK